MAALDVREPREEIEERSGSEVIGVEAVNVQIELEESEADRPPEYASVLVEEEEDGCGEHYSGAPPLSYAAVMAVERPTQPTPPAKVLTVEAPPSYQQLFGKEEATDGAGRGHRRMHDGEGDGDTELYVRLSNLFPKDQKSASKCGLTMLLLIFLSSLSVIMIVVGSVYYTQCMEEIPLYLIVAGIFLLLEIVLQTSLWTAQRLSNDRAVFGLLRKCDCIALFLVVWLVVGSIWIFKAGKKLTCDDVVDYVAVPDYSGHYLESFPETENCQECPSGVYVFTAFLILFQYLMTLVLAISCCSSSVRRRRH